MKITTGILTAIYALAGLTYILLGDDMAITAGQYMIVIGYIKGRTKYD